MLVRPLEAHHSFASEFDAAAPVVLTGTVSRVEWTNPHTWIFVDVPDATGRVVWAIEATPPNGLWRRGLRPDNLAPGLRVVVHGYRAKSGTATARGRALTLPDGRTLSLGSSDDDVSQ